MPVLFPHGMYSHGTPRAQEPELQPSLLEPLRLCTAVPTDSTRELGHHRAPQGTTETNSQATARAWQSSEVSLVNGHSKKVN